MFERKKTYQTTVEQLETQLRQIQASLTQSNTKLNEISEKHKEEVEKLNFDVKQRSIENDELAQTLERYADLFFCLKYLIV